VGLRVWDIAAGTNLVDGLQVDLSARTDPESAVRAYLTRSGVYAASGLPGLRPFEFGAGDEDTAWTAALRRYRVEIRDPQGRFLPLGFDADLPARGLFTWLAPGASPPQPLILPTDHSSPPATMLGCVPLFSAPSRAIPAPLAALRAQLRELGNSPAAYALLTASIDGTTCGIGLADDQGRVAIFFAYPDRPRPPLTSPPQAKNDFRWDVALAAYYVPRPPGAPVPAIPDLADILAQLNTPRTLFASTASPPQLLTAQALQYGVALTLRTEVTPTGPSSYLFVNLA
jgi:hypothetical protein